MASSISPIVEPLLFHHSHGADIGISENNSRATRSRLSNNLIFSNRPILPEEIVQIRIEELSDAFQGLVRLGLTTNDPASLTGNNFPRFMPQNDGQQWIVPTLHPGKSPQKNKSIRLKYSSDGTVFIDFEEKDFSRCLTTSPITQDVWLAIDLNGGISQVRLIQSGVTVSHKPAERAYHRFREYTKNGTEEHKSHYYSEELVPAQISMNECDPKCEVSHNIAVRQHSSSSITVEEILKRRMVIVMQVLDMDHTLSNYFTIRCLTNRKASTAYTRLIDSNYDHIAVGNEIGIRVQLDGTITFSCDNRCPRTLFKIDLILNDDPQVRQTEYFLEFVMNGRVTGLRSIGVHQPSGNPRPPVIGGGCQATIVTPVCPNALTGLLLPCQHLCVCHDCGKIMLDKKSYCPKCRSQVSGCVKVFRT